MEQFPSNSHRPPPGSTDKTVTPGEEVKLESVVTGKVVRRKKPLGTRIKEMFFSGETGVINHLIKEVLVPALQDAAVDMVKQGIERAVYRGDAPLPSRQMRGMPNSRSHTDYTSAGRMRPTSHGLAPNRQVMSRTSSLDIGETVVDTKFEAEQVLNMLFSTVQQYGEVTVANLKELTNETGVWTDNKYGWRDVDLEGRVDIRRARGGGYALILPPPIDLR